MSEEEIQGVPAPPDTKSWLEYSWKLQQDVPNRFEDASKFLATIISLTITIVITALDKLKLIICNTTVLFLVLVIWLFALGCAFMVLFPHKYSFHSKSVARIKEAQQNIIKKKKVYFLAAALLYFISLSVLVILALISIG